MNNLPAHAKLSASRSGRWTACPGSLPLEDFVIANGIIEKPQSSGAAREGTALHAMMEHCLIKGLDADDITTLTYDDHGETCTIEPDDEQIEAVQLVLDKARSVEGTLITESRVVYGRAINQPDNIAYGTVDIAVIKGKHVHVMDAKFGRHFVDHVENTQMLLYAIGLVDTLKELGDEIETVTLHIIQPRSGAKHRDGWEVSAQELEKWVEFFKAKAKAVEQSERDLKDVINVTDGKVTIAQSWVDDNLYPSDSACRWCRANPTCPAKHKLYEQVANQFELSEDLDPRVNLLSNEQIEEVLGKADLVMRYIKAVEDQAFARLLNGKELENYHLVVGRQGNRKWKNEADAVKDLVVKGVSDDELYTAPKLKTPAQLEKVIGSHLESKSDAKKLVDDLTERAPAKPTLASKQASGTPWVNPDVVDDFDPI